MTKIARSIFALFVALVFSNTLCAQTPQELAKKILAMDKVLFDAFNACNIKVMSEVLDQDLEFYHDKSGLTDHSQTIRSAKNNCDNKLGLTRTLLSEYNAIFPAGDYGAIQEGRHQFCHMENGKNDCGTFKFVHIWKNTNGQWTISRVISYDH